MHRDVLEWLWFLQTFAESFAPLMYGDKDMFPLAFALANKSSEFRQVIHHALGISMAQDAHDSLWDKQTLLYTGQSGYEKCYSR